MENIHSEMYSLLINTYIKDPKERWVMRHVGVIGAMMSGAGVRTSADNGSWVLTAQDQWTCGPLVVGCQHETIAVTEPLKLCACLTSIYLVIELINNEVFVLLL